MFQLIKMPIYLRYLMGLCLADIGVSSYGFSTEQACKFNPNGVSL
jgi:hypothetical protein